MISSMESQCLSFREIPQTTKLFTTFLEDFSAVAAYYAHPPSADGVAAAARQVNLDPAIRRAVVDVLREQNTRLASGGALDEAISKNLDRLAAGAVAIVTGQQVGLFSGPAYSIYKAISAIRVAEETTRRGIDAVPIFWLATEDHDLVEVNHSFWNSRNSLARYDLLGSEADAGRRVGEILLGPAVEQLVATATAGLEGSFAEEVARALRESYAPGETYGSAYGKLMARLLAGRGIIYIDPLDERLHRLTASVYRRALDEAEPLRDALIARSKELDRAGFHAQVKVAGEATVLFYNVAGRREPLRSRDGKFFAGEASFTRAEIAAAIEKAPGLFTPSVLFRPTIQDSLLPTAAYIGGPAEVAYMAQAQVVYEKILGRMPAILPRASFTIIEPLMAKFLSKFDLDFRDILRGAQHVRSVMDRKALPQELARQFESGEEQLRALLKSYAGPIEKLDSTLLGTLASAEEKMLHQFLKLKEGVGRAQNFRTGILDNKQRILLDALYPNHELQERSLCILPFIAAYGPALLDDLSQFCSIPGSEQSGACTHQHVLLMV
jgi:bacillithiol biosynthesis cysteine-adding enzyme BshC